MNYRLTNKLGQTAVLEAARYEQDGSGVRFYDASGAIIASFYDGEIRTVVPASVEFGDNGES